MITRTNGKCGKVENLYFYFKRAHSDSCTDDASQEGGAPGELAQCPKGGAVHDVTFEGPRSGE